MTLPPGIVTEQEIAPPTDDIPPLSGEVGELPPLDAPAEEPRRKRGRPRKRGQAAGPGEQLDASSSPEPSPEEMGALADAFGMTFDYAARFMASRRGAHWALAVEEKDILGQAWANALAPYMGTFAKYTPVVAAVVVTAGVLGPRVQQDAMLAEEEAKRAKSRTGSKAKDAE